LITSDKENQLKCESCGNEYLIRQNDDQLSLSKITTKKPNINGNNNVVVQIKNIVPIKENDINPKEKNSYTNLSEELVECPICGRMVEKSSTFRCRSCQKPFICLSHQNEKTYLCSDCETKNVNLENNQKRDPNKTLKIVVYAFSIFVIGSFITILVGFFLVFANNLHITDVALLAPLTSGIICSIPALITGLILINKYDQKIGILGIISSVTFWGTSAIIFLVLVLMGY
jgi:Ca2+/Na+ antiporter